MRFDASQLLIEDLIVHDVPKPTLIPTKDPTGAEGMILSEIESALTGPQKNFVTERISASLAKHSSDVVFNPELGSPVPELVLASLQAPLPSIVEPSRRIAEHLYASQSKRNPAGILAIIRGSVEDRPCLVALKIERQEGMRVRSTHRDGRTTFDIQVLTDLMLTQRTRVFKAAVFVQDGAEIGSFY